MFKSIFVLLLSCISLHRVYSQTGGTTAAGDSYVCVPAGYCNNNGSPGGGIDPRIVTPNNLPCPSGQVACYTQGPNSRCGTRFITSTNAADGVADDGAYPWQVYLQNATNPYAGSGVLLDNYHVLTAAHKVAPSVNSPSGVRVLMGVYTPTNLTTHVQRSTVSSIILHPSYDPATLRNDLAILQLSTPIQLSTNYVNTACLPASGASYTGQNCIVAGWGQTAFNLNDAPTNPIKQVTVRVVDYTTCRNSYLNASLLGVNTDIYLDASGEICAGGESMKDACTQDGGSPLVCPNSGKYYIAGLVIWGKNCGQPGVYGVYVSVPYYRNWIDTTITSLNAG